MSIIKEAFKMKSQGRMIMPSEVSDRAPVMHDTFGALSKTARYKKDTYRDMSNYSVTLNGMFD